MRILVYPHNLDIGGSQINAIDLAAGVASRGHDVSVYAIPGPLSSYIGGRGLRYLPARRLRYRPAPSRIAQLAWIAKRDRIELIHAYEWPPCLDAFFGAGLALGVPVVCTVLGMTVMPYVPARMPLIMGTAALGREARQTQRGPVWVIEPPIDVAGDHPGIDGHMFRHAHGVAPDDPLVVCVSRLALDLKIDALVRAIDAMERLSSRHRIRLIIVGDGPARAALQARGDRVNAAAGRAVVTLAGATLDPRPAYAAADVVVGMGSSAMRAAAIGKPVVVQGERGFSLPFEPETLRYFVENGFYGMGDDERGVELLAEQVEALVVGPERRRELGLFGRASIVERFSLDRAVDIQCEIYEEVRRGAARYGLRDVARAGTLALGLEARNHDPRAKQQRARHERLLLDTARDGAWPPLVDA